MSKKTWSENSIVDMTGKTIIITGANTGLGYETAKVLASKNATIIFAVRNVQKGQNAVNKILKEYPNARLKLIRLDLMDSKSIRAFVEEFKSKHTTLDILINNAGIMMVPYQLSNEKIESHLATNHFGHFALTGLLMPLLKATSGSRVVTVSSFGGHRARMDFDNLDASKGYKAFNFYSQSKFANILFAKELQNKFNEEGLDILSIACHPGNAVTELFRHSNVVMRTLPKILGQSAYMGALPTLYAATDPSLKGGEYVVPDGMGAMKGYPKLDNIIEKIFCSKQAQRLWAVSETLMDVDFDFRA